MAQFKEISPSSLESIYALSTPGDIASNEILGYGINKSSFTDVVQNILVDANAAGGASIDAIIKTLNESLEKTNPSESAKYVELISILTNSQIQFKKDSFFTTDGDQRVTLQEFIDVESDFFDFNNTKMSIISVRSPFITPAKKNTNHCDLFMNSIPSIFASQMVPYFDVEFQTQMFDAPEQIAQGPGLVKFLVGTEPANSPADVALLTANRTQKGTSALDKDNVYNNAGMEMFTTPQSLVNMDSLVGGGTSNSNRYMSVLDPFRPYASIENAEITIAPAGAGSYTYKKASLSIKLHDRSRLTEFTELIRPKAMKDVFVWLTYGWLAPVTDSSNAYAQFINKKMLTRECYKIVNSSFTFDNVGQITFNISLWTQGVTQLETKTWAPSNDVIMKDLNDLIDIITQKRKLLMKAPPDGINADIRIYQLLDSAEAGNFPDMDSGKVTAAIASLEKMFDPNSTDVKDLITALKKFTAREKNSKKFEFEQTTKKKLETKTLAFFQNLKNKKDPFIPNKDKKVKGSSPEIDYYDPELIKALDYAKLAPTNMVEKKKDPSDTSTPAPGTKPEKVKVTLNAPKAVITSFGKLFSSIVLPSFSKEGYKEIQIIFYALNEQCGPVSLCSIAEFPIDINPLSDLYVDHARSRGGDKITINEFMQMVINSQFLDKRAIGYGLRQFYGYYSEQDRDIKDKNGASNSQIEDQMSLYIKKYGGFKLPNIDIFVESLHVKGEGQVSEASLIDRLNNPAHNDASTNKSDVLLRLHVYDKQLNPFRNVSTIIRKDNNEFASIDEDKFNSSELVSRRSKDAGADDSKQKIEEIKQAFQKFVTDSASTQGNATMVRDRLANTVPKIMYGTNGTTIISANLASKQDPLLSTVNMLRNERIKNTAFPNGAGDYGLPMRVVPAALTLSTLGNPLACMAQQYFVDFNTGTTLDNLYIVTALAHRFSPGKFESTWTMAYSDAYGQYLGAATPLERIDYLLTTKIGSDTTEKNKNNKSSKK